MQGYNELRDGAAWLDVSGREKIRVAAGDRARLLHTTTTNRSIPVSLGNRAAPFPDHERQLQRLGMAYIVAGPVTQI